jgi:hypothetical protein
MPLFEVVHTVIHLKSFDLIHEVNITFLCTIILLINYLIHLVVLLRHQLAKYFPGVSKRFGTDISKMLKDQNLSALRYGDVIISIIELTSVQIIGLLPSMPVKPISLTRPASPTGKLIYGYNPSTNTYQI